MEWGRERKTPSFFFSTSAKVEIWAIGEEILPVKLIFSAKTEISGEKSSEEKKEMSRERRFLPQKWLGRTKKGGFGVEITGRG